jgi:hypothetical protein
MAEIAVRRALSDRFEVTLRTEYHESVAFASTIGQALTMAADTIQWPIPEGLPRMLDGLRGVAGPLKLGIEWVP